MRGAPIRYAPRGRETQKAYSGGRGIRRCDKFSRGLSCIDGRHALLIEPQQGTAVARAASGTARRGLAAIDSDPAQRAREDSPHE